MEWVAGWTRSWLLAGYGGSFMLHGWMACWKIVCSMDARTMLEVRDMEDSCGYAC